MIIGDNSLELSLPFSSVFLRRMGRIWNMSKWGENQAQERSRRWRPVPKEGSKNEGLLMLTNRITDPL